LHVAAPALFGGLESVLALLAVGQTRRGHNVRVAAVISPDDQQHPFVKRLDSSGVPTTAIRVGDRNYLGERSAVRALCRDQRADVVHTHGFRSDFVDGGVARKEGIATVSTCHGFIDTDLRGRAYQWLQRRALKAFDGIVAVSSPIQRRLLQSGVAAGKIHLVPNAYEPTQPVSRNEARRLLDLPDATIIGWVGRLSHEKGLDLALEAFAEAHLPDAYLVVIGTGREEASLRELAQAKGVANRVLWRGAVPNAERLFGAFDVFLLSSRTEGTPMVLLEAMAAKTPIVATEVGGVPDVVDASCAQLTRAGDVHSIARGLTTSICDPDGARNRARRAGEILRERFDTAPWLMRYDAIYRSVVRR
jgi:glycosyltransferase involved in cell wall biosynthesis